MSTGYIKELVGVENQAPDLSAYLPLAGGTMTGDIDLDGNDLILTADGNTKILGGTNGVVQFFVGGGNSFKIQADGFYAAVQATRPIMVNEAATSTNPVWTFQGDLTTGVGKTSASKLALIAGATAGIELTATTMSLYGAEVSYGANDSGGGGFKLLRVPN